MEPEQEVSRETMTWSIDGMHIHVFDKGQLVLTIFLGEAIEASHRFLVESHIEEINRSPWIPNWHNLEEWNRDSI